MQGGSIGPRNNDATVKVGSSPMSYNVTFDGVDFHDSTATDSAVHTECLWAGDVQGLTVKNSLFRNCAYFGLFVTHLSGTDAQEPCDREQRVRARPSSGTVRTRRTR